MAAGILCKIYIDRACLPHFSSSLSTTYYQVFVVVVVVSVALLQRCHQCCKNKMEQKRQKFSRIAEKFAKYLEWYFLRLLLFIKCTCYSFTPWFLPFTVEFYPFWEFFVSAGKLLICITVRRCKGRMFWLTASPITLWSIIPLKRLSLSLSLLTF